jgi:hypothetical protein
MKDEISFEKIMFSIFMRSILAFLGSMIVYVLVSLLLNPFIDFLIEGKYPIDNMGPIEPMAYSFWCCCGLGFLSLFVFPLAIVGEWLLIRKFHLKWWLHIPIMSFVFLAIVLSLILGLSFAFFREFPELYATLVLVLDVGIMSISFWLIFRVLDKVKYRHE